MAQPELLDRLVDPDERLRVLIVVAHPDDETVGAGGHLGTMEVAGLVHLTDGAPRRPWFYERLGLESREEYVELRRRELVAAMEMAGVDPRCSISLSCADQEAMQHLERVTTRVRALIEELEPEAILTHPYEGGHPDHDSAAFVVQAARTLLQDTAPPAIEMSYYHRQNDELVCGSFLSGQTRGRTVFLDRRRRELKQSMLDCFRSQAYVLSSFPIGHERFRIAPRYDFLRPPHDGPLYYETLDWQIDWRIFRRFVAGALDALGDLDQAGRDLSCRA